MELRKVAAPQSLCRTREPERGIVTVAAVQISHREDAGEHRANLERAIRLAASQGAQVVFLPELTLSRYPADVCPSGVPSDSAEPLLVGQPSVLPRSLRSHWESRFTHRSMRRPVSKMAGA